MTRARAALLQADWAWYGVPTGQFLMRAEACVQSTSAGSVEQRGTGSDAVVTASSARRAGVASIDGVEIMIEPWAEKHREIDLCSGRDVAEEKALHRREPGQREDRQRRERAKVVRMPQEHGHKTNGNSRALDGLDDPRLLGRGAAFLTHGLSMNSFVSIFDDNDDQSTCAAEPLAVRELLHYNDRSKCRERTQTAAQSSESTDELAVERH